MKFIPHTYLATREVPPTVTTGTIATDSISGNYARLEGSQVTSDGGAMVTARGAVWSTSQNPTIVNSKTIDGSGLGVFGSHIEGGLTLGTTYYVRAYATNSAGTSYGNQISFTTDNIPSVTTDAASGVSESGATLGGNVTSDNGDTVTSRGIAYNTGGNPTISDTSITVGSGTGAFVTNVTGLTAATTYYVRAWASNNRGIAYGNQINFITPNPQPPSVLGSYQTENGNQYFFIVEVTSVGSENPTQVGVTVNGTPYYVSYGGGLGTFYVYANESGDLFGPFGACTTNTYTAFATNSVGTATSGGSIIIGGTLPNGTFVGSSSRYTVTLTVRVSGTYTNGDGSGIDGTVNFEGPDGITTSRSMTFNPYFGTWEAVWQRAAAQNQLAGEYKASGIMQTTCGSKYFDQIPFNVS